MFLGKYSRFARVYDLRFYPRNKEAKALPLFGEGNQFAIEDAFAKAMANDTAKTKMANGDVVELVHLERHKAGLALLFHRGSPGATDPAYRRLNKDGQAGPRYIIREGQKAADEEQSVSATMLISDKATGDARRTILEEIPGLSMGVLREILAPALRDYEYEYFKGKEKAATYTVMKAEGVKAETLTNALKTGNLGYVTLTRPAKAPFVDADGAFDPTFETMRLKVTEDISADWKAKLGDLMKGAKAAGWEEFSIDIALPDERRKTVRLEQEQEAKEVLFVRSESVQVATALKNCSLQPSGELLDKFSKLMGKD